MNIKNILYIAFIAVFILACKKETPTVESLQNEKVDQTQAIIIHKEEIPLADSIKMLERYTKVETAINKKEGYIESNLLQTISPGDKFSFVIFSTWKNLDNFKNAAQQAKLESIIKSSKNEVYTLTNYINPKNTNQAIGNYHVLYFNIDNFEIGSDFDKTFLSIANNLSNFPGCVYQKLYKTIDPKNSQYHYVMVSAWNTLSDETKATQQNTMFNSQIATLPSTIKITHGYYKILK